MVTERDRFTKCFGKVFDTEKSKILILGTLPPCESDWYYQKNNLFWEILSEALELPELSKPSTSARRKKELLINNGIALWDIFKCAWRKDGNSGDEFIVKNKERQPNKIYDEIISKGKINLIIINGLEQALMWFMEFNQEPQIKEMISAKKVISLQQTMWVERQTNPKYKLNWINTIKKALGKTTTAGKKPEPLTAPTVKKIHEKQSQNKHVMKKTKKKKDKKIVFVVKKNKDV